MVTQSKSSRGNALALVLFALSLMLLLAVTLNQVIITQQRGLNNSTDYQLAQNYAKAAMLDAESVVYNFDSSAALEAATTAVARYTILSSGTYDIDNGTTSCNSSGVKLGWCYNPLGSDPRNSDPSWQPWTITENAASSLYPCNSYSPSKSGANNAVPLIDEKSSLVTAHVYSTGDTSLCDQPRYIMEPINLFYTGRMASGLVFGEESGGITQANGVNMILYKKGTNAVNAARLYRITVRAFGRNGNTRVTLQEIVAIANNSNLRGIGDSANIPAHNIIPISMRWIR